MFSPPGRLRESLSEPCRFRRISVVGSFCLALAASVSQATGSQIEPLSVSNEAAPAFDVYTGKHGLSAEVWTAVGVDSRGFVWAGSASSLARFDGYRWQPWPVDGASSLVRDFGLDSQGRLWALFEGDGVAVLGPDDQWRIVQDLPGLRHFFERKTADGQAQLWLSYGEGLARLVGDRWQPDPGNGANTKDAMATAWTRQLQGRPLQWLARYNRGGLWHREVLDSGRFGPWRRADLPEVQPMAINYLKRTVSDGREELWILSYTTGLVRLDSEGLKVWRAFDSCTSRHYPGPQPRPTTEGTCRPATLPTEAMYSAEVTYEPDGTRSLWLSTRAGLVRIRDERIFTYGRENGLPSDAVRGLARQVVDGVDVIWSATESGLARAPITDSPWRTVSLLGASENGTFGVMLEPDGSGGERLWVGSSQRGLALLQQGRWRYFNAAAGNLPSNVVRAIWRVPGPSGKMWRLIAFGDGGLYRITDQFEFEPLTGPFHDDAGIFVDHVLPRESADGHELWVATFGEGVYRLKAGQWTHFGLEGRTGDWRVLHLLEQVDASGRSWLWALGIDGLARFDGERWAVVDWLDKPEALDSGHGMLVDHEGRQELWVATIRHGVVRLDVTSPETPVPIDDGRVPPAPDPTVYSVLSDSRGHVYVCTNNGVQRLSPGPDDIYTSLVFTRSTGLVHDECNSNSQLIDGLDRYWVGTLGGLSLFDPGMQPRQSGLRSSPGGARPLHITGLTLDGEAHSFPDGRIQVPAGTREIRIDFSLLSGLRETDNEYRSQLIGYEREAAEWTQTHWRYFTDLAPGDYIFRIEAVNYAGIAAVPMSVDVNVAPFWWQRRDTQSALLIAAVLLIAASVMYYNRGLRMRQQELKRMVAERTRELSDANERLTELSYRDPLTGLANRRRLMMVLKQEMARARDKGEALGIIIVDVDHFKPYNDTYGHVAGDVALSAISEALVSATRKRDMVARLGGEEFACLTVNADVDSVNVIAERMRRKVAALLPRELGNETDRLTISAGVLVRVPRDDDDLSTLLRDCDAALYEAKHAGRDCVRVAAA